MAGNLRAQENTDSIRYRLPGVTVLATRTPEPWIQVPFALTSLDRAELAQGRGYGLDELLADIPGVLAQSRAGSTDIRLSIRGFGARGAGQRSNAGTTRGVRVLADGFPETEPDGRTSFDMLDIAGAGAVEVMRSNASSIYGNASGGVINVVSNTMFESPFGAYAQTFGSFGLHRERVNAGVMLGTGKLYLSLGNTTSEGWRSHSAGSQTLLNTGITARLGDRTNAAVHIAASSNLFRIPGALTQEQYDANPQQSDPVLFINRDERRNNRVGRIGVTVSHELDDDNMFSASAFAAPKFLERSERNQYRLFTRFHVGGSASYRHAASLGPDLRNTLLLGADEAYQDGSIQFYFRYNLLPNVERGALRDNKREGANNLGGYVQDEIAAGDRWIFLVGARYDNITYSYESYFDTSVRPMSKPFERVTPKAGVTFRISPTQSVYANLGGGVEVPAGNETDPDPASSNAAFAINPVLDPIVSTTVEIGTKQIAAFGESGAWLTYDVAGYWLRVSNDIIPYSNGTLFFTAGRTERMGFEASARLSFAGGISANAAITASSNKYKEYVVDSVHYGVPGKSANYAENEMAGVPGIFFTLGARYAPPSLRGWYVSANLQHVGGYFVNDANTLSAPAYSILNGSLGFDHLELGASGLYLGGFITVNNIAGVKYVGSAWLNPDIVAGRPVFIEPGLPRNYACSVSLGWEM